MISDTNKSLERDGWRIVNSQRQGKPAKYRLAPIEKEAVRTDVQEKKVEKKPVELKVEKKITRGTEVELLNGKKVIVGGKIRIELLKAIDEGVKTTEDLTMKLYGKYDELTRQRLIKLISALNKDLFVAGIKVENAVPTIKGIKKVQARYIIKPIEGEVEEEKKSRKKEAKKQEGEEIELLSGQKVVISGRRKAEFLSALDEGLANSPDLAERLFGKVNVASRAMVSRLARETSKDLSAFGLRIRNIIPPRNRFHGMTARYQLESIDEEAESKLERARQIDEIPSQEVEEKRGYEKDSIIADFYEIKDREVELPNGKILVTRSAMLFYIAESIREGNGEIEKIATKIYLEYNIKNKNKITAGLSKANIEHLNDTGFKIINITPRSETNEGVRQKYAWQDENGNIFPIEKDELDLPTEEPIATHSKVDSVPRAATVFKPEDLIDVPYVPEEDEIRTDEENRVLNAITSQLRKSSMLDLWLLQRTLKTDERTSKMGERIMYRIYQAEELKEIFTNGLDKFIEESRAEVLRNKWADQDIKIWENITFLLNRFSKKGEFKVLKGHITKLINEASENFYNKDEVAPLEVDATNWNGGTKWVQIENQIHHNHS